MLLFIMLECEKKLENKDIHIIETNLTGEWTVNAYMDNNMIFGPFTITTQMTSDNDSLSIKDNGAFWKFQTKAEVINPTDVFEANESLNEISNMGATINILNGIVINNDSIAFDIQFEDDETPYGITYTLKGSRK